MQKRKLLNTAGGLLAAENVSEIKLEKWWTGGFPRDPESTVGFAYIQKKDYEKEKHLPCKDKMGRGRGQISFKPLISSASLQVSST